MNRILNLDAATLIRKKRSLRVELESSQGLAEKRIAILCGPTLGELKDQLELILLAGGIRPNFWVTEYNRYYETAVFGDPELESFKPDLIYLHTSVASVTSWPVSSDSTQAVEERLSQEWGRFKRALDSLRERGYSVLLNNFEDPPLRLFGNLDAVDPRGRVRYISRLNELLAGHVNSTPGLYLHDLRRTAAWVGLRHWHDRRLWHWAKLPAAQDAMPYWARSLGMLALAIFGRGKKLLALDLDNTLWGGVVGDDGVHGLKIGPDEAEGEAFLEFQRYAGDLRSRGMALAVVSKNEDANARAGLGHPDGHLKEEHFAAIRANWEPKSENLQSIAHALNLGRDSFVFVDDNPVERALVAAQTPDILVPDMGADVSAFAPLLDALGIFEIAALSQEDLGRAEAYAANGRRDKAQAAFSDYGQFLDSLGMRAEIGTWKDPYFDRISQLANKSNQFNLTTLRLSLDEARAWVGRPNALTLYGKLNDRFGEHGLVSIVAGTIKGKALEIELWLMSCRVLKRGMEYAMLDSLVEAARAHGASHLLGRFFPTAKNGMVREFYGSLGFERIALNDDGSSEWRLNLDAHIGLNRHIEVMR